MSVPICVVPLGCPPDCPPSSSGVAGLLDMRTHVREIVTGRAMRNWAAGETAPDCSHMRRSANGGQPDRSCWRGCFLSWPLSWAEPQSMGLKSKLANSMLCCCGDLEHSISLGTAGKRFSSNPHCRLCQARLLPAFLPCAILSCTCCCLQERYLCPSPCSCSVHKRIRIACRSPWLLLGSAGLHASVSATRLCQLQYYHVRLLTPDSLFAAES